MIVQALVRLVAWRALLGRTLAGDNVGDSRLEIDDGDERDKAVIVVFTDAATGTDLREGDLKPSLTIEYMVTSLFETQGAETPHVVRDIAVTSTGLEFLLNVLGAQLLAALRDTSDPWAELLRRLSPSGLGKPKLVRAGNQEKGVRRAAAQLTVHLDTIHEPVVGEAPSGVIEDVLAALEADPVLGAMGRNLRLVLTGSGELDDGLVEAMRGDAGGLGREMLDIGPALAALFTSVTLEDDTVEPAP